MEAVSVTEFRNNIKKYLDIAKEEELIIYRSKNESFVITPLKKRDKDESLLSPAQKKAIDEALEDVANGNLHSNASVQEETKKRFPHLFTR
ncbi:prevent-host-death family protein [Flavobacterium succinicans]|jgi:prevent-host-death family protein|uniref:Antitoxin n=1 Tax=Flavobacterium succinicans TaxID=29536 RepID=A0A1I4SFZ7_9FLAO|nr:MULTISPECIES: type II toxin-antitoxin system prevent-host-death family antitoxin [Flavobacterium]OOV29293.1 prevent-host-death family protein [Flavobacterium sp. LM5]SFM63387.1 prevent-host-death family protein [Flavobacterium succinicans]